MNMDYIVAILIIPMTAIYFVHWDRLWKPMQHILLVFFVFLVILIQVQNTTDSLTAPGVVVAAALAIPLCYWLGYFVYMRWVYVPDVLHSSASGTWKPTCWNWGFFPKYEWGALLATLGLSAIAIALFATQGMFAYSWVPNIHAMWHIFAALGQYFLMEIKAPSPGAIGYYKATRETWQRIRAQGGMTALYRRLPFIDTTQPLEFVIESK
jgi:hypothetical protein